MEVNDIKALYTVSELAQLLGISRWRARRIIAECNIELLEIPGLSGPPTVYVPVSELRDRCPVLWSSLIASREAK